MILPDTTPGTLPRAAEPFLAFSSLLRENTFAVAPEQVMVFIEAVGLLGPKDMASIHRAARATLAPPPERHAEFDALFRLVFLGQSIPVPASGDSDEEQLLVGDDETGSGEPPDPEEINEAGGDATEAESLGLRHFDGLDDIETLRRFRRQAPQKLPWRKSYRRAPGSRGRDLNMRKALRMAVQRDGELIELPRLVRQKRQRRIVLLIDISGSMKQHTDTYLRFAHSLAQVGLRIEIFSLGTRLTRITRALKLRNRTQALAMASTLVADWDGGTRLGDALQAFLAIPRYAGFTRGAAVVMLSDGLERGDPAAMIDAVEHLSRLAWKLAWLTPLAADPEYSPETTALKAVLPYLNVLDNGSSISSLCNQVLALGREAA